MIVKTFPDKDCDYEVMWEFLKDLDGDSFLKSISNIIMTKNDINKATNMIALIRENAIPKGLTAGEAWAEILEKISSVGSWGYPKFANPLINEAVSCIGWRSMCMSENISIERAHFLKVFESLSTRKRNEDLTISHDVKGLINSISQNMDKRLEKK